VANHNLPQAFREKARATRASSPRRLAKWISRRPFALSVFSFIHFGVQRVYHIANGLNLFENFGRDLFAREFLQINEQVDRVDGIDVQILKDVALQGHFLFGHFEIFFKRFNESVENFVFCLEGSLNDL
jgi:hypothetical protein